MSPGLICICCWNRSIVFEGTMHLFPQWSLKIMVLGMPIGDLFYFGKLVQYFKLKRVGGAPKSHPLTSLHGTSIGNDNQIFLFHRPLEFYSRKICSWYGVFLHRCHCTSNDLKLQQGEALDCIKLACKLTSRLVLSVLLWIRGGQVTRSWHALVTV